MITNRQNTKIQLGLTIFVGSNRTLVVRVDPNRDFKTESNRKSSVRFGLLDIRFYLFVFV
jgi:hypothetical protein